MNSGSRSALHVALDAYEIEAARLLLEAGADVNHTDLVGRSPIMGAARSRDKLVRQELLQLGANPDQVAIDGTSALQIACTSYWPEGLYTMTAFSAPLSR